MRPNNFPSQKGVAATGCLMILFTAIVNLAFFGGLIYLVFWCLNHFHILEKIF